jgi:hypothetical protein
LCDSLKPPASDLLSPWCIFALQHGKLQSLFDDVPLKQKEVSLKYTFGKYHTKMREMLRSLCIALEMPFLTKLLLSNELFLSLKPYLTDLQC